MINKISLNYERLYYSGRITELSLELPHISLKFPISYSLVFPMCFLFHAYFNVRIFYLFLFRSIYYGYVLFVKYICPLFYCLL